MAVVFVAATEQHNYTGSSFTQLTISAANAGGGEHLTVIGSGGIASVTDLSSNTYVRAGSAASTEVWYAENIVGMGAGGSVTVTWSASGAYRHVVLLRHRKVRASGSLGAGVATGSGSGGTISCTPTVGDTGGSFCVVSAAIGGLIGAGFSFTPTTFTLAGTVFGSRNTGRRIDSALVFDGSVPIVATHADTTTSKNVGAAVFLEGPIQRVSTASGADYGGTLATTQATSAFAATAGNHIVVVVRASNPASSVADTAGNSYVKAGATSPDDLQLWYAENIAGHASNVVTVTFSTSTNYRHVVAYQHEGFATAGSLGGFAANHVGSGATSVACSPSSSVATGYQVCVAAGHMYAGGAGFGLTPTGFTIHNSDTSMASGSRLTTARVFDGTVPVTLTNANTAAKGVVAAVFLQTAASAAAAVDPNAALIWPPF